MPGSEMNMLMGIVTNTQFNIRETKKVYKVLCVSA